jgi:hypothetical protein
MELGNSDVVPAYPVPGIFITNEIVASSSHHAVCNILEHGP